MRRENEIKHAEGIQKIVTSCEHLLKESSIIVMYAPGINKQLLASKGYPFYPYINKCR